VPSITITIVEHDTAETALYGAMASVAVTDVGTVHKDSFSRPWIRLPYMTVFNEDDAQTSSGQFDKREPPLDTDYEFDPPAPVSPPCTRTAAPERRASSLRRAPASRTLDPGEGTRVTRTPGSLPVTRTLPLICSMASAALRGTWAPSGPGCT